jgi:4-diphosphocytidyl-2-C-methyl-D-erythritol kinase
VPFFLSAVEMALVEGIGERVTPIRSMGPAGVLTVTPTAELSTARVFERYDAVHGEPPPDFATDLLDFADLPSAASRLRDANDLWRAAVSLEPNLEPLRDKLESATTRPWLMSGSGPTLFAIYPSVLEAAEAGRILVRAESVAISTAAVNAVDLVGPDPAWRYP